jgi:single-stranded-DNA-specific exonuclease
MGRPQIAAALFFEKDPVARGQLAGELVALNRQRRQLEEEIWGMAESRAYQSLAGFNGKLALVYGGEINKGVTGLIAQRVARHFNVVAIAVSFGQGVHSGSIRSARGYAIGGLLEQCGGIFLDSGGHEYAGGFSLKPENWEAFMERLKAISYSIEFSEGPEEKGISIDAELPFEYLGPDILGLVEKFAPYGKDNEPLMFLAKKLVVEDIAFIGKNESKHLKLTLAAGKHKWPALYWDAAARVINKEFGKGDFVDVVFTISRDWFKGIATPQMMVNGLRRSA